MSIADNVKPDRGKQYIATGRKSKVTGFYQPNFQYTTLGKFIIFRLKEDRDVKIVITGKGKTTGTGKTTLAIHLANWISDISNYLFDREDDWSAKEYSFMNVWEYLKKYKESESGDPLITDELEHMFERRRAMSDTNTKGTQAWSILRYKNVVTIGTAPGLSDVDKRIPEGADIWINVIRKGVANPYYLTVNDFTGERIMRRLKIGKFNEQIMWNPIEDSEDYQYLKSQKENIGIPGIDDMKDDSYDESDLNELERNIRHDTAKNTIIKLHENGVREYFNQETIGEAAGISQAKVSQIERELKKEGVIDE